jgi:hypothetical protein
MCLVARFYIHKFYYISVKSETDVDYDNFLINTKYE